MEYFKTGGSFSIIEKGQYCCLHAGQAVATAHIPLHALGSANYALQAIHRASSSEHVETLISKERGWQLQHLKVISNG